MALGNWNSHADSGAKMLEQCEQSVRDRADRGSLHYNYVARLNSDVARLAVPELVQAEFGESLLAVGVRAQQCRSPAEGCTARSRNRPKQRHAGSDVVRTRSLYPTLHHHLACNRNHHCIARTGGEI